MTEHGPSHEATPFVTSADGWALLHALRPQLVAFVRRQGLSHADAEDVASEALLRAAVKPDLEEARAHAWTQAVARNLAVDVCRRRPSATLLARVQAQAVHEPDPADAVAERGEADWAASLVADMPARQRSVLVQRALGVPIGQIAEDLAIGYKATESLLSRGRSHLRGALLAAAGSLAAVLTAARRHVAMAAPVLVAMVATTALIALPDTHSEIASPSHPAVHEVLLDSQTSAVPPATPRQTAPPAARTAGLKENRPSSQQPKAPATPLFAVSGHDTPIASHGPIVVERHDGHQSVVQTVVDCVRGGVDITQENVGCRSGRP